MGLFALSMAGPISAGMLGDTQGDMGKGALKGGLEGLGIGAMIPMMMGGPLGLGLGAGVVAFKALTGAISASQKSAAALAQELDNEDSKRSRVLII